MPIPCVFKDPKSDVPNIWPCLKPISDRGSIFVSGRASAEPGDVAFLAPGEGQAALFNLFDECVPKRIFILRRQFV